MAVTEASHAAARALDDLYRRHGPEIYRYALAVLGNHADAEDVTQTTFLNAYRALEQGVRPRKPVNWLLTIASNAIKQRFRQEQSRPHVVALDREVASNGSEDDAPSVGELLTALSKIPPQQRQALVLREFEGRSYREIAEILSVTTSALETLLFRARRSLTEELTHQLTCTEAQQAISRAADRRLGRKEKRRLGEHVAECPDCAQFAHLQQGHRKAMRGLALVPVPLSFTLFKGLEGSAAAATLPAAAGAAAAGGTGAAVGSGVGGGAAAGGGGLFAGGLAVKAAAVVAAASVAGGVTVAGVKEVQELSKKPPASTTTSTGGKSHQPHAQRAGHASASGLAHGKALARGQNGTSPGQVRSHKKTAHSATSRAHSSRAYGQLKPAQSSSGTKTRTRARTGATKQGTTKTNQGETNPNPSSTNPTNTPPTSNGGASSDSQSSTSDTTSSTAPGATPSTTTPPAIGQSAAHSNKSDR